VQTISTDLAKLRTADLVRYDSDGKNVRYWLKHRGETRAFEVTGKNRQISEPIRLARHFDVSRILETWKFPNGDERGTSHEHVFSPFHEHGSFSRYEPQSRTRARARLNRLYPAMF
jgi:hypothetical protein